MRQNALPHAGLWVSARLFVTERTVEVHVKQIFMKLHLDMNAESHRVLALLAYLRSES